mmetsp:Transcript_24978/g.45245  ORF Transcript_24978/g.45245 Transcript_24978/m.45245 type:complete len:114 (-) Transcript_24978:87-428(-)
MFALRRLACNARLLPVPQFRGLTRSSLCLGSEKGVVKKWLDKGFGFIEGADGQEYFVHWSGINTDGFKSLAEGEEVEFDLEDDPVKGGKKAANVTGPGGAPPKGAPRGERDSW